MKRIMSLTLLSRLRYNIFMKTITSEQIQSIMGVLFEINAPVKVYDGVQKLFNSLPDVVSKTEGTKEVDTNENKKGTKNPAQ